MGPPVDSVQLPKKKWLNSMVYGRYNYSFHGGYFMVYKPTYIDIYYGLFIAYRYNYT